MYKLYLEFSPECSGHHWCQASSMFTAFTRQKRSSTRTAGDIHFAQILSHDHHFFRRSGCSIWIKNIIIVFFFLKYTLKFIHWTYSNPCAEACFIYHFHRNYCIIILFFSFLSNVMMLIYVYIWWLRKKICCRQIIMYNCDWIILNQ